jgi:hypothetical protein
MADTTSSAACWYRDPKHRPTIGWCPADCNGPNAYSERAGDGSKRLYCEAHAYWRRKTIGMPIVRRMRVDEPLESPQVVAT